MSVRSKKVLLVVMDGWGWRDAVEANAVRLAKTPHVDRLWETYPRTLIQASGPWVGLPDGQMGNSEVGHLNLGAGRVVYQDIVRIDRAIRDGSFFSNAPLAEAMDRLRTKGALHLIGLLSDGGVHSHQQHVYALLRMAKAHGVKDVFVHAILDGRDTAPHGGERYLSELEQRMREEGIGSVATIVGRYFAMDRDRRWERTRRAYDLFTVGDGLLAATSAEAIRQSYDAGITDEFVEPALITKGGSPRGLVRDGDSVVFFNFRADRARQITHAFTDDPFAGFERRVHPRVHYVGMARYENTLDLPCAFPPESRERILVDTAASAGKTTLRIAETEKYAHVTYFFNGGEEKEYPGETRVLIPSPKVATYDLQPEMSAAQVTDALIREIRADRHDYIVCNFANPDMVGHTGVLEAAVKACETVDACVGRVLDAVDLSRYALIVTADHGNCEMMIDPLTGGPHTAHTTNPVPCILVDPDYRGALLAEGSLRDVAPTILNYLGVERPDDMTGEDLRADVR
jgi:2,3-bisphosphoglycerate-independent phosphoglycerate mutase